MCSVHAFRTCVLCMCSVGAFWQSPSDSRKTVQRHERDMALQGSDRGASRGVRRGSGAEKLSLHRHACLLVAELLLVHARIQAV